MKNFALLGALIVAFGAPAFATDIHPIANHCDREGRHDGGDDGDRDENGGGDYGNGDRHKDPDQDCGKDRDRNQDQDDDQDQDGQNLVQCAARNQRGQIFRKVGRNAHATMRSALQECQMQSRMSCVMLGCRSWH